MGNILSLEQLVNETIAEVAPINNNFETIRVTINDNDRRITSLKNETSNNLQSLKKELIDEIVTVKSSLESLGSGKANSNLDNIDNLDKTGTTKILDYILPNTSIDPITITSGFIAPTNGWVYLHGRGYSESSYSAKINDFVVYSYKSDAGLDSASFTFPVLKGDKIEFSGSGIRRFWSNLKSFEKGEEE